MTELTEIDGVGPTYAENLQEEGYENVSDIANADPREIDSILPRSDGSDVVEKAQSIVGGESEMDDSVVEEQSVSVDGSEEMDEKTYTIEPGFSVDQENHLIGALTRYDISVRSNSGTDNALDEVRSTINEIKSGEPYELTPTQYGKAYTSINQLEEIYRAERGINEFVSEIREVKLTIKEKYNEVR